MAKTHGPLNSIEARGKLSGVLTYYRHNKRNYAAVHKRHRGLFDRVLSGFGRMYCGSSFFGFNGYRTGKGKTQLQSMQRYLFSYCWREYKLLTPEEKQQFALMGRAYQLSGPQYFMKQLLN